MLLIVKNSLSLKGLHEDRKETQPPMLDNNF